MKSYQFFKIFKRFDKERKKTLMEQSMRKTEKSCSPIFAFWYQDDARNIKRGSRERQIARNGKLQYLFQK